MALKLYERYPQLWESPSNDYPQGAFKNLSAQGETDGSYLEKDWLNDYSGFFGALLKNAQMTPDGTIDTAQRSQFYDALIAVARKVVGEAGYLKKSEIAQEWGDREDVPLSQKFLTDNSLVYGGCIKDLLNTSKNVKVMVDEYYRGVKVSPSYFYYDSNMPKTNHNGGVYISDTVPWDGSKGSLNEFLNGTGETNPTGNGCWVREHGYNVYVSWFGAVADARRPQGNDPTTIPFGTDSTESFKKCSFYIQRASFHPNFQVGHWGGFAFTLEPNSAYKVTGDNVLGTTMPRSTQGGDAGTLSRVNWFVEGNASIIMWVVEDEYDRFIETHETLTSQWYRNFTLWVCNAYGSRGIFYSNQANPSRNATLAPRFERVIVNHSLPNSTEHGLKYMFYHTGTNLGDRTYIEQCEFRQAHTFYYSENGEAVGQSFTKTSFVCYLDGATFFHFRRHGSGFNIGAGCNILMKGDLQTLFKLEYVEGGMGGTNGTRTYMNMSGCRLEVNGGKRITVVDAEFGVVEIEGIVMDRGGLANPLSEFVRTKYEAVVRFSNCNLQGRIVVGEQAGGVMRVNRNYSVKITNCNFTNDVASNIFVEHEGTLVNIVDAVSLNKSYPAIIIEGTDTKSIGFDGQEVDRKNYVFDNTYTCNTNGLTTSQNSLDMFVGEFNASNGLYHLRSNEVGAVMPSLCDITDVFLTSRGVDTSLVDKIRVYIGDEYVETDLSTGRIYGKPFNVTKPIQIRSTDIKDRSVYVKFYKGDSEFTTNHPSFVRIKYSRSMGANNV